MAQHATDAVSIVREGIEIDGQVFADPFDIPATYSCKIDPELYPRIFEIIENRYADLIQRAFRDPQVGALLLCDRQVVERAATQDELDEGHIRTVERERGHLCFVVGREDMVEECAWNPAGPNDHYPTLRLRLGAPELQGTELQDTGIEVAADFDTGNPRHPTGYDAFDDRLRQELAIGLGTPRDAKHLGRLYGFSLSRIRVGVRDKGGAFRDTEVNVRFVTHWDRSPFVRASPQRRAFVGREIMFGLRLRITLDPLRRLTLVDFA